MRLRATSIVRTAGAAAVVGVVLAIPTTARAQQGPVVSIHDYQYHPPDLAVPAGTAVTWTNEDEARHDLATTSGPAAFQSPELATGESYSVRLDQPGTYAYLCTLHPDMVGSVSVSAPVPTTVAPTTTAAPASPSGVASPPAAPSTTAAPVVAAPVGVAAVPAAATRSVDVEASIRPYLVLLALVAAVVLVLLLLLGVGQRTASADA